MKITKKLTDDARNMCDEREDCYVGGALPSTEDARDWKLSRIMDMPTGDAALPSKVVCYILETVRDQGKNSSCTAHAMATIFSSALYKLYGLKADFSVGYLYGNRRETSWQKAGEFMRDVPKKAVKWGDVPTKIWDSSAEMPDCMREFEAAYPKIGALSRKLFKGYVRLCDKNEAKSFMVRYEIPLFVNMKMKTVNPLSSSDGLHALACFKYSPVGFTCVNSWGTKNMPYITDRKFSEFEEVWGLIPNEEEIGFQDVPEEHWAYDAISEAAQRGELCGFPDGSFHPDEPITRAQAAVLLQRIRQLSGGAI